MSEHTKEQLGYGEDNDGWYVSCGDNQIAYGLSVSDARRIVACVNSCAQIPTEWLEQNEIGPHVSMCGLKQFEAEQQRDKLLKALKEIAGTCALALYGSVQWDAHKNARAIIAEVEASK